MSDRMLIERERLKVTIGILYICTGKYTVFWKEFYESCEKNLLEGYQKKYFVFTDAKSVDYENNNPDIIRIYQENLGWPDNTLKRFHFFLREEDKFRDVDYLYFFNANLQIVKNIGEEILPQKGNIMFTVHPGFYGKSNDQFPYEKNPFSTAYIPEGEGRYYVAGGLNGGDRETYLNMLRELKKNIDTDFENSYVAVWHDESHINSYIYRHSNYQLLPPEYLYPEGWELQSEPVILIRDKAKYGGHTFLREGESITDVVKKYQYIYIYGAGEKGKRAYKLLHSNDLSMTSFIISDGQPECQGENVIFLSELSSPVEETLIIIAVKSEYEGTIKLLCSKAGYKNIYIYWGEKE